MSRVGDRGIALVAALLVLAATGALAAATFALVNLDLAVVRNRQAATLAQANAQTLLVQALLAIGARSQDGELPGQVDDLPGVVEYRLLAPQVAQMVVEGSSGTARHETVVRIELRPGALGWKLHVPDRR